MLFVKSLTALAAMSPLLAACDVPGVYTYRAEVGYYQGSEQRWFVGSDKSYDACLSEAAAYFNNLNREHAGRAFSWACRRMRGEDVLARVR
jgi:hypothetical protein